MGVKSRVSGLQGWIRFVVLLAVLTVFFPGGCSAPVSPPAGPETHVLVVRIAGGPAAQARTALPSDPGLDRYDITVSRGGSSLGSLRGDASKPEFPVPLSAPPDAGDEILVEAYDGADKLWAQGSTILPSNYVQGDSVDVILSFLPGGTGNIYLSVDLPASFIGTDDAITAAELSLYRSLEDYQAGAIYRFMRYRKDNAYGSGTTLGENLRGSVPIVFNDIPSGNYVVTIDFFRFKFVRVSRLAQTIIVRNGLDTNGWDGGSSSLSWDADKFASSNADLSGINIDGAALAPSFSPTHYSYSIAEAATQAGSPALTITGVTGQTIEAKLTTPDKTTIPVKSGDNLPLQLGGTNSISITVAAPDGVTKQTYTVSYTYYEAEWYVSAGGSDSNTGTTAGSPCPTVGKALNEIKTVYVGSWPGKDSGKPVPARINISGEITETVDITDNSLYAAYPPIILAGSDQTTDKIKVDPSKRPLAIKNATVILGDGLALTGGNVSNGGGVNIDNGSFTMNGGSISGNTATSGSNGGGVYVTGGSSFTMNGGSISDNKSTGSGNGGGVYIDNGSFTMNGGSISGNNATNGGGVYVAGGSFTMDGGGISGNNATNGGGVYVDNDSFTMNGGTVSGNQASDKGGGVFCNKVFTMNGGTIRGNTVQGADSFLDGGGGVYVAGGNFTMKNESIISGNITNLRGGGVFVNGSGSKFTMEGGTISGNQADGSGDDGGGGVFVRDYGTVAMSGGTISGNTTAQGGGGVNVTNYGTFTMMGGIISGNAADNNGGGTLVKDTSRFTMSNGTIRGNTSSKNGGGVWNKGDFTMSGGTIRGNTATLSGGGVYVDNVGSFTTNTGTVSISGNNAGGDGGGVYVAGNNFTMNVGTISGNTADSNGGGVYVAGGSFTINTGTVTISGNTARGDGGGGVYIAGGGFVMSGGTLKENETNGNGGGVYIAGGAFTMNDANCSVIDNLSQDSGGGVYIKSGGTFTMHQGTVGGNTSTGSGGGVLVDGGSFTMNGGTVSGNNSDTAHDSVHSQNGGSFTGNGGTVTPPATQ